MEQPTPHSPDSADTADALIAQLRECYGRVAYSTKAHEKCADIYHQRLGRLKLWQIILAAVTTGGLITTIFGEAGVATIIAAITSTILLALNTYTKEHDLGELAQKHANAASDLWDIRESYLSLLTDLVAHDADLAHIREERDRLQEALKNAYQGAPRTITKAYKLAQEALKINEELTFSDAEIDNLLPEALRKTK